MKEICDAGAARQKERKEQSEQHKKDRTRKPPSKPKARRATSADRTTPAPPPPTEPTADKTKEDLTQEVSPPVPPSPPNSNYYQVLMNRPAPPPPGSHHYPDQHSDSDNDAAFLQDNGVDFISGSLKSKDSTSTYSARRAGLSLVSHNLRHATKILLDNEKHNIFSCNKQDAEACADSGATHHMLNDYTAFTSYHATHGDYVTLGDDTRLPIAGSGSAIFSLNGRPILIRDALHVPGLRAPLYSLRQHRKQPGCGLFSDYEFGNYILFPHFVLRVDDSDDNIVSYKSLGNTTQKLA